MFSKELQYFISNQNKLLKKYQGKFLVTHKSSGCKPVCFAIRANIMGPISTAS